VNAAQLLPAIRDLSSRPQEKRAWESYTAAYQEARESRGIGHLLERGLTERAISSEAAG